MQLKYRYTINVLTICRVIKTHIIQGTSDKTLVVGEHVSAGHKTHLDDMRNNGCTHDSLHLWNLRQSGDVSRRAKMRPSHSNGQLLLA